ncbi:S8 family serine peptidase [Mucilaginibacter xinganensis]|uniref:Por secretion system C-terminal sorting domain-containing protein n=1 Tax=Mucilaginibacter xinganensis TaxID=1234841 RepID=A0A223P1F0_9SPHI|nr:S8 family serine peptidase [Mucilaginibacter xinganensis]ASU35945.1 Por secretion system C-terminal sorting domain-containing protein [Mucilaginibacter xinganensis]
MNKLYAAIACSFLLLCFAPKASGQQIPVNDTKKKDLANLSARSNSSFIINHTSALALAKKNGWLIKRKTKNGGIISLQGVNSLGFPVYLKTDNNTTAAATTNTNTVQPGGITGLNLSGSGTAVNNKLAIWDGGSVYKGHQEFAGKTITLHDSSSGVIDHATHVSGTMIAKGVYAPAKGMAFNAATLQSYDFDNDVAEMSAAASGLLLSNHSYGDAAGWYFNDFANHWEWYGLPGDSVDYNFGFYGQRTQDWDKIAFNAPYYLIVESAGNSRADNGPAVGQDYYGYQSKANQTLVDKGPRPAGISSNNGYDIISTTGNAKNILTVGAINPLPNGPANASDISISYFSSYGPTDDGRIKPDIVGDGVDVLSTGSSSSTSYLTLSGTSMSAPNITGSLYLLQEYYAQQNGGKFMRAATLKGLACHTAFDAGNAGPDYIYGWGLLNMSKAAQAITDNNGKSLVKESTLQQGQKQTFNVIASGNGTLAVTISWTDPAGTPTAEGTINSRIPKLVNDLDLRVGDGTTTFNPWTLDPLHPSALAKTGDNILDNIEQVYIPGAVPGMAYTITVSHKGTLQGGSQDFSLIATGVGGSAYCVSNPLSTADSKINKLALANLNYTAPVGCTGYSNHTDITVSLEQGKTYPLTITLGTCGSNFNKAAKVYIDWNGNGVFDANELAATTGIINATGTYTANISVPVTVVPDNYSLMRVVLGETNDTAAIKPCGTYAKGETQDYKVQFLQTGTDAGVTAIVSPAATGACPAATQITVSLKNFGRLAISNIPVLVTVTAPDNTITTLNETYAGTLQPLEQEDFILNSPFNAIAGSTYKITAATNLANDAVSANNQVTETVTISVPPVPSTLTAYYCADSKQYQVAGTGDGELLWYRNINDAVPVAYGTPASIAQAPVNSTYYAGLNDFTGSIGPVTKNVFTGGGYNQFTPYVSVSTKIPVIIESARLYIGNAGKITFTVADASGRAISSTTINAAATRTTPLAGPQPDDPNDQGAVYNLNLLLPAAGNYTINVTYDNTATIYRNNAGVAGYPFTIGNIFSITGNNATSGTDTAAYKGYYYYLYDIKVKSAGCTSAVRVPVVVSKPVISQNGTTLNSSIGANNQWYLNGKAIAGATGANYTPVQSGNYQVALIFDGCTVFSDNYVYIITSDNTGNKTDIGLITFPVPASTQLNVLFAAKNNADLTLSIINAAGQVVYKRLQAIVAGNFSTIADVTNLPPGNYILKVQLGQKVYNTKIIILR